MKNTKNANASGYLMHKNTKAIEHKIKNAEHALHYAMRENRPVLADKLETKLAQLYDKIERLKLKGAD